MSPEEPAGIGQLLRSGAAHTPSRCAIIAAETRLTWAEFDGAVTRAALAVLAAGAVTGDRVALELGTGIPFAVIYLGALRAGLVAVPVNPAYTPAGDRAHPARLRRGAAHHGEHCRHVLAAAPGGRDPRGDPHLDRGGEAVSVLLYTSGTSGRPKGAMLSARALLANLDQLAAIEPPVLRAEDVLFLPLPLCHVFALNAGVGMALLVGATVVLADRFDPAATPATTVAERVSAVLGVPGLYVQWLRQPGVGAGFASVRFAMSGSATLPAAVVDGYAELGVVLHNGYGLTEAAPVVTINAIGRAGARPNPGSIAVALPGVATQPWCRPGRLTSPGATADGPPTPPPRWVSISSQISRAPPALVAWPAASPVRYLDRVIAHAQPAPAAIARSHEASTRCFHCAGQDRVPNRLSCRVGGSAASSNPSAA